MDREGLLRADGLDSVLDVIETPVDRVRDVATISPEANGHMDGLILVPTADMRTFKEVPALDVDLGQGISIVRLDDAEADRVMHACAPRGHNFLPYRQFGQGYTVSREVPRDAWLKDLFKWDYDGKLRDVLAMSRLILDTGYSTEFAARIIDYTDGQQKIVWVPPGPGKLVYRVSKTRDWLTYTEAEELRNLLAIRWSSADELGSRITRAMWNLEYAAELAWLDVMIPIFVITLESFTNTSSSRVTRQFTYRVPRIVTEAGGPELTEQVCRTFYKARSRWAHGDHIQLKSSAQTDETEVEAPPQTIAEEFGQVQAATRAIVRRAIEDPDFRARVESKASVRSNWPIPD